MINATKLVEVDRTLMHVSSKIIIHCYDIGYRFLSVRAICHAGELLQLNVDRSLSQMVEENRKLNRLLAL